MLIFVVNYNTALGEGEKAAAQKQAKTMHLILYCTAGVLGFIIVCVGIGCCSRSRRNNRGLPIQPPTKDYQQTEMTKSLSCDLPEDLYEPVEKVEKCQAVVSYNARSAVAECKPKWFDDNRSMQSGWVTRSMTHKVLGPGQSPLFDGSLPLPGGTGNTSYCLNNQLPLVPHSQPHWRDKNQTSRTIRSEMRCLQNNDYDLKEDTSIYSVASIPNLLGADAGREHINYRDKEPRIVKLKQAVPDYRKARSSRNLMLVSSIVYEQVRENDGYHQNDDDDSVYYSYN